MAVPANLTIMDISGKFTMNKTLSDYSGADAILKHQGVGMLKRQAIGLVTPTVHLRHFADADGVEHLEIAPHVKGMSPKVEVNVLTWTERAHESPLLGKVVSKTRRIKADALGDAFLASGWTADTLASGLIQTEMHPAADSKWTMISVWGIEDVGGERRHTRHVKLMGPKDAVVEARFVYDYEGPV